jgi:hypothetical protein
LIIGSAIDDFFYSEVTYAQLAHYLGMIQIMIFRFINSRVLTKRQKLVRDGVAAQMNLPETDATRVDLIVQLVEVVSA